MTQSQDALRAAYQDYLRRTGLDLLFADHAPKSMSSLANPFAGGSFDPKAAKAIIRALESSRGYRDWPSVGSEPEADFLWRLATVRTRGGPYLGDKLPYLQRVLDRDGTVLLNEVRRKGTQLPFEILFGLNPSGDFNARVEPVAGGALVLLNAGAMDLMFTVLKINLAAAGDKADPPKLNQEQTMKALAEAFNAYLYGEFSLLSWPLPRLDANRERLLGRVLPVGELFMLAHEIGHVALGHVRLPKSPGAKAQVVLTPASELEADEFAVDLVLRLFKLDQPQIDDEVIQFIAGGMMNFLALQLTIETLASEFGLQQVAAGTHPAVKDRWEHMGQLLEKRFPSAEPTRRASMFQMWLDLACLGSIIRWLHRVDEVVKRPGKYSGPFPTS